MYALLIRKMSLQALAGLLTVHAAMHMAGEGEGEHEA